MTAMTATGNRDPRAFPAWKTFLLAAACGLIAANLYHAQPLAGPISVALGLSPWAAGLIVTLTQVGYGAGLLLVVPLSDLFENRRLALIRGLRSRAPSQWPTHSTTVVAAHSP